MGVGPHRQELVAHQAQVPLPQGSGAQQHPAIPTEVPALPQHQHHPGEEGTAAQALCAGVGEALPGSCLTFGQGPEWCGDRTWEGTAGRGPGLSRVAPRRSC